MNTELIANVKVELLEMKVPANLIPELIRLIEELRNDAKNDGYAEGYDDGYHACEGSYPDYY